MENSDAAPSDEKWIADLTADGPDGDAALRRLHELLLRASRHQVYRLRGMLPHAGPEELTDLAMQAADEATVSVLRRLDTFEGRSRFSTWAYKFAVYQAGVEVRKQAWRHKEISLSDSVDLVGMVDHSASPSELAEATELARAVEKAIRTALTPHQRRIAIALVIDEVPIDVLADRLGTTRNALYKTLHDARRRLRAALADCGHLDAITDRSTA
ncbi:sigma-70 family RNA polymerase sigma factor [Sporichthya polymorpha]|uniref:sigma-70 family RNA polymerase sigma factor n=1 Tax=Sporichthya polymorpha TaxID=35751 RepID=UPI000377F650|nr:sigma-70 family RNA polymerase sigma factor [Sporichthya polymorpha]